MSASSARPRRSCVFPGGAAPWAVLVLTGCIGGQTGGEIKENDNGNHTGDSGGYCADVESLPLDSSEATLGFTAESVIEAVRGTHTTDLSWAESPYRPEEVTIVPEAGTGTITVSITPLEESAEVVRRAPEENNCVGECASVGSDAHLACQDQLRFEADVHVTTDNGALDETWRVTFSAESPYLATARVELTLGTLHGSFDVSTSNPDTKIERLHLDLALAAGTLSGALRGEANTNHGEVAVGQGLEIARFPVEGCPGLGGYPMAEDGPLASSTSAALAELSTFDLAWSGGGETTLTLSHEVRSACLQSDPYGVETRVIVHTNTHALTDDGGIDGIWPLEAHVGVDANWRPASLEVLRQAYLAEVYAGASFASESGISAIAVSPDEQASFTFSVNDDLSDDQPATGELTVLEIVPPPPCNPETVETPGGGAATGGCEGSTIRELGGATFVAR